MNKTDEVLPFGSFILVRKDRKQKTKNVVERVATGKKKGYDFGKTQDAFLFYMVFINHQKSIGLILVVVIVEKHFIMIMG